AALYALSLHDALPISLAVLVVVKRDFEVALQTAGRGHVTGVALVTHPDVLDRLAFRGELAVGPRELRAEAAALVDVGRLLGGPRSEERRVGKDGSAGG